MNNHRMKLLTQVLQFKRGFLGGKEIGLWPVFMRFQSAMAKEPELKYLQVNNIKLAYRYTSGAKSPGVIFVPGYGSNMTSSKAIRLEDYCREHGHPFLRFDYESLGKSTGDFSKATLGDWKDNLLSLMENVTSGPQLLVGSSMGAWISLLITMQHPEKVHSLLLLSNAMNFTVSFEKRLTTLQRAQFEAGEFVFYKGDSGELKMTKHFVEESRNHLIDTTREIDIRCPVCIIHGKLDYAGLYESSLQLLDKIKSPNADVILRKTSGHRLSEEHDLELLISSLDRLIKGIGIIKSSNL